MWFQTYLSKWVSSCPATEEGTTPTHLWLSSSQLRPVNSVWTPSISTETLSSCGDPIGESYQYVVVSKTHEGYGFKSQKHLL